MLQTQRQHRDALGILGAPAAGNPELRDSRRGPSAPGLQCGKDRGARAKPHGIRGAAAISGGSGGGMGRVGHETWHLSLKASQGPPEMKLGMGKQ